MRSTTDVQLRVPMTRQGPNDRLYPATRLAAMLRALASENVLATDVLRGTRLSQETLSEPGARVSCNDTIEVYRNALRLSRDPHFAFHAGLRCNVATFGMFGLALLSSATFRKAIACALQYHRLTAPLCDFSFREEPRRGVWSLLSTDVRQRTPVAGGQLLKIDCLVSGSHSVGDDGFQPDCRAAAAALSD